MVVISRLVAPENLVGLVNCDFIFYYVHNAKMPGFVHAARMIHERFLFTRAGKFFFYNCQGGEHNINKNFLECNNFRSLSNSLIII
jgi:hypothetical protein